MKMKVVGCLTHGRVDHASDQEFEVASLGTYDHVRFVVRMARSPHDCRIQSSLTSLPHTWTVQSTIAGPCRDCLFIIFSWRRMVSLTLFWLRFQTSWSGFTAHLEHQPGMLRQPWVRRLCKRHTMKYTRDAGFVSSQKHTVCVIKRSRRCRDYAGHMSNRRSIQDQRSGQIKPCMPAVLPWKQDGNDKKHSQMPAYWPLQHE